MSRIALLILFCSVILIAAADGSMEETSHVTINSQTVYLRPGSTPSHIYYNVPEVHAAFNSLKEFEAAFSAANNFSNTKSAFQSLLPGPYLVPLPGIGVDVQIVVQKEIEDAVEQQKREILEIIDKKIAELQNKIATENAEKISDLQKEVSAVGESFMEFESDYGKTLQEHERQLKEIQAQISRHDKSAPAVVIEGDSADKNKDFLFWLIIGLVLVAILLGMARLLKKGSKKRKIEIHEMTTVTSQYHEPTVDEERGGTFMDR